MRASFFIAGRLAGLNDIIGGGRWQFGAHHRKRKEMERVQWEIKKAQVPQFNRTVTVTFTWIEANLRRDPDNVSSGGAKIILDAMVHESIIPNDTRRWVKTAHEFAEPNKEAPGVIVEIDDGYDDSPAAA